MRCRIWPVGIATVIVLLSGCGGAKTVTNTLTVVRTTTVTKLVERPAEPAVYVAETGGRLQLKPSTIVTGVSGGVIHFDKWLSYGGDTAKADVRFEFKSCDPDCASGKFSYVKARVALSSVVPCRGVPIYETMTVIGTKDQSLLPVGHSVDLASLCHEGTGTP